MWQKKTLKRCKIAKKVHGFIASNFNYMSKELILPLYKSNI